MSSPTSALSYLLHCWLLQPMAEPEPRVPHRVNPSPSWLHGSASWARIVHTECIQLVAGRLRLLWCCIFEVRCRVWSLCALTCSSGSLSLTSGVRWPAWSRATAASLSSAPPPPPPANRSPARWSPGRHWKLRTSTPTTILPPPIPSHCPYRSQLSSCPYSSSLDSVPIAQPVSTELKHACTNRSQRI